MSVRNPHWLLIGGLLAAQAQAQAAPDNEALMQALQRLTQRVEQLEQTNQRLLAELAGHEVTDQERDLVKRLADVEIEVLSMRKQARMIETVQGISASAALTMVAQEEIGSGTHDSGSQLNYRGDVSVTLPGGSLGEAKGRIFAHFRVGQGEGLSLASPTYTSTPNTTAFYLDSASADDANALLAQAWYQLDVPLGASKDEAMEHVEINLGKIDPFVFFDQNAIADDESSHFLNNAFVHNPLLDSGGAVGADRYGFSPGVRIAYHNGRQRPDWWRVSLGAFGAGEGASYTDSFDQPFLIGQLEVGRQFLPGRDGTWRLYAWSNTKASAYDGATTERHAGWGLSLDQLVTQDMTVFARYGHALKGHVRFDRALTLGTEIGGSRWQRGEDRLGLAVGWLKTSDGYGADDPDGYSPGGAERLAELYYAWQVNEHFELSPDLQWIGRPGGNAAAEGIRVVGLRARVGF